MRKRRYAGDRSYNYEVRPDSDKVIIDGGDGWFISNGAFEGANVWTRSTSNAAKFESVEEAALALANAPSLNVRGPLSFTVITRRGWTPVGKAAL
jgi:hypothetical protein